MLHSRCLDLASGYDALEASISFVRCSTLDRFIVQERFLEIWSPCADIDRCPPSRVQGEMERSCDPAWRCYLLSVGNMVCVCRLVSGEELRQNKIK